MDDPNITMEEYIRLEEEKAQKRGKVFNWETAQADPAPVQAPQPPPPPSAAGSSPAVFERRTRQMAGEASTSVAPQ
ncbi:hypothetical protein Tco_0332767 [Tanacetum coccineum]